MASLLLLTQSAVARNADLALWTPHEADWVAGGTVALPMVCDQARCTTLHHDDVPTTLRDAMAQVRLLSLQQTAGSLPRVFGFSPDTVGDLTQLYLAVSVCVTATVGGAASSAALLAALRELSVATGHSRQVRPTPSQHLSSVCAS
jgi:hypothetical protein